MNPLALGHPQVPPAVLPLPPAHSVPESVRALNTILQQLSGAEALAALRAGDSCSLVDTGLWAPAWEGARSFRDHFILNLARATRDEWRRDVADVLRNQPQFNHDVMINRALDSRLRITLDFSFRFLTRRHVCFLGDALALAFECDLKPAEFALELATSASRSPGRSPQLLEALVLGASGMHRFQPERVLASGL